MTARLPGERWGRCALFLVFLWLSGCSQVSPQLDKLTGSSKSQRCQDYRGALPFLELRQAQDPKSWRADLIQAYELFLASNCRFPFEGGNS
ncbi:hypothetical protein ACTL6U_21125 [Rhodovibrionaceae bacterium A322]